MVAAKERKILPSLLLMLTKIVAKAVKPTRYTLGFLQLDVKNIFAESLFDVTR